MANVTSRRHNKTQSWNGLRQLVWTSLYTGKLPALVILGACVWLFSSILAAPQYLVRHIEVQGGEALTAVDVATLTNVTGRPIWFVEAAEIEARVRQSPYVEDVQAQMVLPDTVLVQVTERRPEVQWVHAGKSFAVSQEGLVLATVPRAQSTSGAAELQDSAGLSMTESLTPPTDGAGATSVHSIVIVDTTTDRVLEPGDHVDPDALEVARRVMLRVSELPMPLQRIEWNAATGVSLIVENKQIVLGTSERLDEKLVIMTQLLRDNTPFSFLDLRPATPYYR